MNKIEQVLQVGGKGENKVIVIILDDGTQFEIYDEDDNSYDFSLHLMVDEDLECLKNMADDILTFYKVATAIKVEFPMVEINVSNYGREAEIAIEIEMTPDYIDDLFEKYEKKPNHERRKD